MRFFEVIFKYMSESISTASEVGVVAIGPIANICVLLFFVVTGNLFYKVDIQHKLRNATTVIVLIVRLVSHDRWPSFSLKYFHTFLPLSALLRF